ncbi:hypothetical protein BGZ47_004939 [Haplosporangium gracile]|nr:hypothetical protein BGZ47_004939 [Haplosporangium gracile]
MAMADSPIIQVSQGTAHETMLSSSANSPITQVAPPPAPPPTAAQYYTPGRQFNPSKFTLDLRGTRFDLDRETLVALPESILVVMFPNGLILRPKSSEDGNATNTTSSTSATATATGTGVGIVGGGAGAGGAGRGVGGTAVTAGQLKGKSSAGAGLAQAAAVAALGGSTGTGTSASVGVVGNSSGIAAGHGHHPSESTYTDYSDYSDYSYDDYDDDDEEGHGLDRGELLDEEDVTDDDEEEEEQVIVVDFDPVCLQYILDNYHQAQRAGELERRIRKQEHERQLQLQFQQQQHLLQQLQLQQQQQQQQGPAASTITNISPPTATSTREATDAALPTSSESSNSSTYHQPLPLNLMVPQNPLLNKQAIIVLREELDYFVIPPPSTKACPLTSGTAPATITSFSTSTPPNGSTSTRPVSRPLAQTSRDSADGPLPLLGTTPAIIPSSTTPSKPPLTQQSSSAAGAAAKVNGSVPPRTLTSSTAPSDQQPKMIKTQCGQILLKDRKIFAALQRNIDKEKNQAEQQLMDMLCVSGFQKEGEWGYRRVEPKRTTVVSVAMVMLRTTAQPYSTTAARSPSSSSAPTVSTPVASVATEQSPTAVGADQETERVNGNDQATPQQDEPQGQQQQRQQEQGEEQERERREQEQKQIRIQQQQQQQQQFQMAIAEKLLLFWRKPARKCWWDGIQVEVYQDPSDTTITPLIPVRLWARRTWTLELVLV